MRKNAASRHSGMGRREMFIEAFGFGLGRVFEAGIRVEVQECFEQAIGFG